MIALLFALIGGTTVEASFLDGRRVSGELMDLSRSSLVIVADGKSSTFAREDLLRLDFRAPTSAKLPIVVRLTDGSRFGADKFESNGQTATVDGAFGTLSIPVENLAAVLLVEDPQEAADFTAHSSEKPRADRIVIAREGRRLLLDGIIGSVGREKIEFTLDGDVLPINRSRAKALYFAQKNVAPKPAALVTDRRGDLWAASEWSWKNGVAFKSSSGFDRTIALDSLASIDLSAGRVVYLSDLEPSLMQHTPALDHPWPMRRDQGSFGGPLELQGRIFAKGLVLHSRTVAEYNLGGEFRRFQSLVGISRSAGPVGDTDVTITADGKPLWKRRVRADHATHDLGFEIAGVKTLRLEVDFGRNLDLGDHVTFADAKVLK